MSEEDYDSSVTDITNLLSDLKKIEGEVRGAFTSEDFKLKPSGKLNLKSTQPVENLSI